MMKGTTPSVIKQEFITTLNSTGKDTQSVEKLITYFCNISWWLEHEQIECFSLLKKFVTSLPRQETAELIPKLINLSQNYPRLVLLAEELFNALDDKIKESISIPMIYWTIDDNYTSISENEYRYRQAYEKPVWIANNDYRRPSHALDMICYQKVLDMIVKSKSKALILTEGWND